MAKMTKRVRLDKVNHSGIAGDITYTLVVRVSKNVAESLFGGVICDTELVSGGVVSFENGKYFLGADGKSEADCWNIIMDIVNGAL